MHSSLLWVFSWSIKYWDNYLIPSGHNVLAFYVVDTVGSHNRDHGEIAPLGPPGLGACLRCVRPRAILILAFEQ